MSIKVFEPVNHDFAHEGLAIVWFNHVGSRVSQDTGRDAQAYADSLEIPVLAIDRPGTSGILPNPLLAGRIATPPGYVAEVSQLGKKVDRQLDRLGISKSIAAGRSAGGLGALALTRSETITSQNYVFAADPVGCEMMTVAKGARWFKTYAKYQKQLQDNDTKGRLIKPGNDALPVAEALGRIASMVPFFLLDKFHNKRLWTTEAVIDYAAYIAENQPNIGGVIEFAEHSLVLNSAIYIRQLAHLSSVRSNFVVRMSTGTTHASYDDRAHIIKLLQPIVEKAA